MDDMKILISNPSDYRYGQKESCAIFSDGGVKWYNIIMLTNQQTMESYVSEYTDYFFKDSEMMDSSINTKKTIMEAYM